MNGHQLTYDFEVGNILNNASEVSHNAVTVEVMHKWLDEDEEFYYIVKCREVFDIRKDGEGRYVGMHPWFSEDEVKLLHGFTLYKYYELEN